MEDTVSMQACTADNSHQCKHSVWRDVLHCGFICCKVFSNWWELKEKQK